MFDIFDREKARRERVRASHERLRRSVAQAKVSAEDFRRRGEKCEENAVRLLMAQKVDESKFESASAEDWNRAYRQYARLGGLLQRLQNKLQIALTSQDIHNAVAHLARDLKLAPADFESNLTKLTSTLSDTEAGMTDAISLLEHLFGNEVGGEPEAPDSDLFEKVKQEADRRMQEAKQEANRKVQETKISEGGRTAPDRPILDPEVLGGILNSGKDDSGKGRG